MASIARRAAAELYKLLASAADAATETGRVVLYQKLVAGVNQLFAKLSDGTVTQLSPVSTVCKMAYYACDDFISTTVSNAVSGGASATTYTTAVQGVPGNVRQTVTTSATPDRTCLLPATSAVASFLVGGGFGKIVFEARRRTVNAQDGTDQWSDRWGMGDATAADATDGIYFESDRAVNGDNNVRLCCAVGGVRTKTSMGVAPNVGTYERWSWVCNAAANSVQGYLNDVATGTAVVTNIPTTGATAAWWSQIIKTAGLANARSVDTDYLESYQLFDAPR